jgi:hypothetical protein
MQRPSIGREFSRIKTMRACLSFLQWHSAECSDLECYGGTELAEYASRSLRGAEGYKMPDERSTLWRPRDGNQVPSRATLNNMFNSF